MVKRAKTPNRLRLGMDRLEVLGFTGIAVSQHLLEEEGWTAVAVKRDRRFKTRDIRDDMEAPHGATLYDALSNLAEKALGQEVLHG